VTVASDVAASARAIAVAPPDLIILDLMLPDGNGYDVLRTIRERDSVTPVLLLTALSEEAHKVRGFRLGADDYVTKPFGLLELLARIESLLRRSASGSFAVVRLPPVRFGDVQVDRDHRKVTRAGAVVPLTPKEYALLAALISRNSAVVAREELLREVWGYDPEVVSRTLDTHLAELRRKLEKDPHHPRHILTLPKQGYRLVLGSEAGPFTEAGT
jgi:two-component system, OmpR family, alkaline phosphatase synthesis response regulator PhoP